MKVYFDAILHDLDGDPILIPPSLSKRRAGQPMTLGYAVTEALLAIFPDEQSLDGDSKARRHKLAVIAHSDKVEDLKVEEVAEIKKVLAKNFGALVVGQAYEILEQANRDEKEEKVSQPLKFR